jgi:hypothetical protein
MAEVVANVAFWHAGRKVHVGDVIDSTEDLYVLYPARFTPRYTGAYGVVGTAGTSAGTLGSLIASEEVLNTGGTVVGYRPVYGTITP